ncbi:ATP-grasp fold amidoligase family protein, partial [Bowmanella dokdonensis]
HSEKKIKKLIRQWLNVDFYLITRERQYKNIERKVIAEEFLDSGGGSQLVDYKVYCFNGKPHMIQVISERSGFNQEHTYYDCDWKKLSVYRKEYSEGKAEEKPDNLS